MLYCIEELRLNWWFIIENWCMCMNNKRVLLEEMEETDFIEKMNR
jgi:hypothetical protein